MLKGIILAGGTATRLFPATRPVSKQLLTVYDKPMIYYPLSTLMLAGIREVLVITNPENVFVMEKLFCDHASFGMDIEVVAQPEPKGIAQAITIAGDRGFTGKGDRTFLILGDNMFHGSGLRQALLQAADYASGCSLFLSRVRDPERYGVAEFDQGGQIVKIHEKPEAPPSPWAVTGLYAYDDTCVDLVRNLEPSPRGELEITDLNNQYVQQAKCWPEKLSSSVAWLDTGTPDALLDAAQYVQAIQHRSNSMVGCPEEIAYLNKWLCAADLRGANVNPEYARYLTALADDKFSSVNSIS